MFTDEIRRNYRIVTTRYGNGESEETIPLGSWRKGSGMAGSRGHVYVKGKHEAGVWLVTHYPKSKLTELTMSVPSVRLMQLGEGEMTVSVPWADLPRLLSLIGAKRRIQPSSSHLARLEKARATPGSCQRPISPCQKPGESQECDERKETA